MPDSIASSNRGHTNLLTGTVHLLDVPYDYLTKFIVRGRLPRPFLSSFLHESMHFWCGSTPLGMALAFLEMRAHRSVVLGQINREQMFHDVIVADAAHLLLKPLMEGMAPFEEFDTFPGNSEVVAAPTVWAGQLFITHGADGPTDEDQAAKWFLDRTLATLIDYRSSDEAHARKLEILMQSFVADQHFYLPGYLSVKMLHGALASRSLHFDDRDLFLHFLRDWICRDWVFISYLLDESLSPETVCVLISERLQERLRILMTEDLTPEAKRFENDIVGGRYGADTISLRIKDYQAAEGIKIYNKYAATLAGRSVNETDMLSFPHPPAKFIFCSEDSAMKSSTRLACWLTLAFLFFTTSCARHDFPDGSSSGGEIGDTGSSGLHCSAPNRVELGKPFLLGVFVPPVNARPQTFSSASHLPTSPPPPSPAEQQRLAAKVAHVTMAHDKTVRYDPEKFDLPVGHRESVSVTLLAGAGTSGLVSLTALSDDDLDSCSRTVDVGFQGHLQIVNPDPLVYDEPRALEVELLDANNKPLSLGQYATLEVQSADASLGIAARTAPLYDGGGPVSLTMQPGASSSGPFRIASTNWKGGPVHLIASLRLPDSSGFGGFILTQNSFSFDTNPVGWLPIVLAISGALLFALYRIAQTPPPMRGFGALILSATLTSILAGTIAWLFADFDLLGIKLDPHVLRTYPLLGFLFSYIGIDVLLRGRFAPKQDDVPKPPNDPAATSPKSTT